METNLKKPSGTTAEIQSKKFNEKLRINVPDEQINPSQKDNFKSREIEIIKQTKQSNHF